MVDERKEGGRCPPHLLGGSVALMTLLQRSARSRSRSSRHHLVSTPSWEVKVGKVCGVIQREDVRLTAILTLSCGWYRHAALVAVSCEWYRHAAGEGGAEGS